MITKIMKKLSLFNLKIQYDLGTYYLIKPSNLVPKHKHTKYLSFYYCEANYSLYDTNLKLFQ